MVGETWVHRAIRWKALCMGDEWSLVVMGNATNASAYCHRGRYLLREGSSSRLRSAKGAHCVFPPLSLCKLALLWSS